VRFYWEGGWDTGVNMPSFIGPNSRILTENPWLAKPIKKNSEKSDFGEFASMEKYTLPILIERILGSQKFNKVGLYLDY
jgi:hypothetical protein